LFLTALPDRDSTKNAKEIMVKIETNQNLFVNLCPTLGQKLTFYPEITEITKNLMFDKCIFCEK